MIEVHCRGNPWQIGNEHGSAAKYQVHGSVNFYKKLLKYTCGLEWPAVLDEASKFITPLEEIGSQYLDEIRGIAFGSNLEFLDILALNVRTEIMFHLFTNNPKVDIKLDGCTSLAYRNETGQSFLGQNWDWQHDQLPNVIICHISQPGSGKPDFVMITEAGMVGKIGLNANGVGVCLNAIRARGVAYTKLPIHIALRLALESESRVAAVESLTRMGVAGSAHILIGDSTGSVGLECTSLGIEMFHGDRKGFIVHTNHLLLQHPGVDEPPWLTDSPHRILRMQQLAEQVVDSGERLSLQTFLPLFEDEDGYPQSINRHQVGSSEFETLFTIFMDLAKQQAFVSFGRPTKPNNQVQIRFS